jgi:predicted phosphodiesterase
LTNTILFVGDVHGNQDRMVDEVLRWQRRARRTVDLVVSVGDFQAFRHEKDMRCTTCPPRHMHLGDYPDYFQGKKSFPAEVLFIGGNHEAYNWLDTMPDGGSTTFACLGHVLNRHAARMAALFSDEDRNWHLDVVPPE